MRALLVTTIALTAAGCLGSSLTGGDDGGAGNPNNSAGSGGSGNNGGGGSGAGDNPGGGAGGSGGGATDPAAKFVSDVQPILTQACKACHGTVQTGGIGPTFMFPNPDVLTPVLAYPGLIASTPEGSLMLLKGNHEGPAFTPDQATVVHDWIVLYNKSKAPAGGGTGGSGGTTPAPSLKPFAPAMTGTNTIDLSSFNSKFAGMKITFTAKPIGNPQTSIQLSNIVVTPTATVGVHMVHPIFNIWDAAAKTMTPDPADSFSNLDETVYMNTSAPLGPGTLVLANFKADSLLGLEFGTIETKTGTGTTTAACKALAMFTANVKPLLVNNTCTTQCHVGANPTAGLAMDATPDATLCVNVLSEVNTTTPANSQLLLQPDPNQNNGHPKKINPLTAFTTAVTNWINAEK